MVLRYAGVAAIALWIYFQSERYGPGHALVVTVVGAGVIATLSAAGRHVTGDTGLLGAFPVTFLTVGVPGVVGVVFQVLRSRTAGQPSTQGKGDPA